MIRANVLKLNISSSAGEFTHARAEDAAASLIHHTYALSRDHPCLSNTVVGTIRGINTCIADLLGLLADSVPLVVHATPLPL
jgi:hypothetical protein